MDLAKPKYVWWDLDCLKVPRDRDPKEVRWMIESALKKKYGDGPVTIFAIGNLNRIPLRVLELISRAGIVIKHTPNGGRSINSDLVWCTRKHPPPAVLMLISDREDEYTLLEVVANRGFTILRTYVNQKPNSPKYASDVWLWKSLLTTGQEETPRRELQGQCCEMDWGCLLCRREGQGLTDFTAHLETRRHLRMEWVAAHPHASVPPTDKDLDSLHSQLKKHVVVMPSKPRKSRVPLIANPGMVKFLSRSYEDVESFMGALMEASNIGPRDCSVVPTEKDLASFHSQPKKHNVMVKQQSKAKGSTYSGNRGSTPPNMQWRRKDSL